MSHLSLPRRSTTLRTARVFLPWCVFCFITIACAAVPADVFYVSPTGSDAWSGRLPDGNVAGTDGPWKTLTHACSVLQSGDTCRLRGGTYRETLKPLRDGTPEAPIVFAAYQDEVALLSGAEPLDGWQAAGDGLYHTQLAWDLEDENQLFAATEMLTESRWPNIEGTLLQPMRATVASGSANTIVDPRLPGDDDCWKGATLWCAGGERWYCWSATVTGFDAATKTLTFDPPQPDRWYTPRSGNPYVLMGTRESLDAAGEWWLDRTSKQLWLKPPGGQDPATLGIEAKRRNYAIDLSARAHIHILGIHFHAGGVLTDAASHHLLLKDLKGQYVGHSYVRDVSGTSSVLIKGHHIELHGCELAHASGSLLRMEGHDNRLINCYLHQGDYAGKWNGVASFSGRRHVISHNTIRHSGRDVCSVHGLMESLIQYNDLSHAGYLTADLGMTYGHDTDFLGTVIRYNWVHDNLAHGHTAGIYFDHCSHNAIVHHNVVWNIPSMPLQVNNPSYFMLCYNNTLWNCGRIGTFDHSHRDDMFGCRFQNNISAGELRLPDHVVVQPNLIDPHPGLIDPKASQFELQPDSPALGAGIPLEGITQPGDTAPNLGASPPTWKAGHDFQYPPDVNCEIPLIAYSNAIRNAAFELDTLEYWTASGSGQAELAAGNGWGNGFGRGEVQKTGTSRRELKLTGHVRVEQIIRNLHPNTSYQLSGWLKVTDASQPVVLGIRDHGGPHTTASSADLSWERHIVEFTTGPGVTEATVFVELQAEDGEASVDNLGLPRTPRGQ